MFSFASRLTARFLMLSSLVCAAFSAQAANSTNTNNTSANLYGSVSGDYTWNDGDNGWGGNVAIGTRIWPNTFSNAGDFRLEAEFGYHDLDNSHYFTYMGNLYYDADFMKMSASGLRIVPYVGGGLGAATLHGDGRESGTAFAYQGLAGLTLRCDSMPSVDWSIGYRYTGSNEIHGRDLDADNVELGLRFHI